MNRRALESGTYGQVERFLGFEEKIESSLTRQLSFIETRRILRMAQSKAAPLIGRDFDNVLSMQKQELPDKLINNDSRSKSNCQYTN